jgi:hypothetical protein
MADTLRAVLAGCGGISQAWLTRHRDRRTGIGRAGRPAAGEMPRQRAEQFGLGRGESARACRACSTAPARISSLTAPFPKRTSM